MQPSAILAIIFSPVVAVLITLWVQRRRERRQQQFSLLSALIATRHEPLSAEAVRALNMIDLVFHSHPTVRELWHDYFDMLSNEGLNNPTGWEQRKKKNVALITEIARVMGYGKAINHLDVDRVYSPVAFWKRIERDEALYKEVMRFLKSSSRVLLESSEKPAPPGGET